MIPSIGYNGSNMISIEQGPHEFFFSYNTLVAYRGPLGNARISAVSRTTGKHLKAMDATEFPALGSESDLREFITSSMKEWEEQDD